MHPRPSARGAIKRTALSKLEKQKQARKQRFEAQHEHSIAMHASSQEPCFRSQPRRHLPFISGFIMTQINLLVFFTGVGVSNPGFDQGSMSHSDYKAAASKSPALCFLNYFLKNTHGNES